MIITLAGGGSTFTPGIVKSIALRKDELEVDEIRLYDINEERQRKVGVLVDWILHEDLKLDIKLTVTTDKAEAFTDADFVFAQMRVGGYAMREQDEKIPLRHGCVGQETCGCGGLAYGMRTIFPMVELIDDVEKYAKPTYWILNYSNPAAIVSEACRVLRPKARIINICDMPIAIIDVVAAALECSKKDIVYDYFGLNHFGWFTSIEVNGEEALPRLREYIKEHEILLPAAFLADKQSLMKAAKSGDEGDENPEQNRHTKGSWYYVWKGVYEIMELFPEYLPNTYLNYYLQQKEFVEHSNPERTRANEVEETREKNLFDGIDRYEKTGEIDESVFYAGSHGDWIADLAIALKNDTKARFLVITENRGALPNMPYDAMVEVPAYIGKKGPEVICQDPIPLFQQGLMMQQLNSEKLLVQGAIEGSYEKVLQAFTLNKTVPSMTVAKEILDDMIEANKGYWPELH
ncbi:6-phospho-alpha-glucosidase [Collinsella tanakaei]|uniref:6-phospho-alpha-glucosidase n=1 Tax=Collinsella sp. An271 TaxID=1965616 RepID=UPI000B368792|nr:6-phospho-alpha-glucosidase [Collinsella sp. An271]MBM6689188.1 6-phospho-alpha-glucosidase [Collinsella tanakaei]MBM6785749.1 6-phospho-alpha-glucosidase [Collinsella tanakaei]MBM6906421.1 6-phospho-alpha-glucosidase [Collinsella tanakaei]MCF6414038.1 6-phospho-alpha-glucosidase [Collinsella tanakaei]OUO59312.1 6-phospho-alpha-glucosidase [Collinsella sp. An271]